MFQILKYSFGCIYLKKKIARFKQIPLMTSISISFAVNFISNSSLQEIYHLPCLTKAREYLTSFSATYLNEAEQICTESFFLYCENSHCDFSNIVYSNRSIYPKEVKALNIGTQLAFRTISTHEIISFLTATYLMEAEPVDIKTIFVYCENFHSEFSNIAHSND